LKYGFEVKLSHLSEKFVQIVKNPKFGHGKNMNPCIDCRILMLKEAKTFMEMTGADFVSTGEVVGQRPMSQMRNTLRMIDKQVGLVGRVLRPLCAKVLDPTVPELEGLVDRERLTGFHGRSRKPQIALAKEFGLEEYPNPASGCLLTDPNYSARLKEMLRHDPEAELNEFHLLRAGRHFRLPSGLKLIVGRDEADNSRIMSHAGKSDYMMHVENVGSPLALISSSSTPEDLHTAASICARYSGARHLKEVEVTFDKNGEQGVLKVEPAENGMIDSLRV
jgi:tRNA-specific 2-thiouridylase